MLILAAVPDIQLHKLRRAAAGRFAVARALTWGEALVTIRSRPVELAVVDPLLSGAPSAQEIERLRVLFPSLPLILYTSLTPETAAVLLTLPMLAVMVVLPIASDCAIPMLPVALLMVATAVAEEDQVAPAVMSRLLPSV